ncbi:MAG TPA: tetratricopeptide repeat protein [Terriglobales bacterium]
MKRRAEAARISGQPAEALRLYQQALKLSPNWVEGWWYVGMIHYDADRFAEAIPALNKVIQFKPNMGPAWAFLGLCEFSTEKYKESLAHLERASELGFGDSATARVANYHRALLLNTNNKFNEAEDVLFSQFGQEKLTPQIAIAMGLTLLRMPILPEQLDVLKKELVFSAGQAAADLEHAKYEEALQLLTAIEKEHPEIPFVHYSAAKALAGLERWTDAKGQLEAELQLSPQCAEVYALLAGVQLKQNEPEAALKSARQAVALGARDPESHHVLSQSLEANGDTAGAARELAVAKSLGWKPLTPKPAPTAKSTPEGILALQQRAAAALVSGDSDAAENAYRQALAADPDWPEGVLNLATIYYSKNDCQSSLPLSRHLIKLQPNVGATWALNGLCEFRLGDYENALVHLLRGHSIGFPAGSGGAISEANYHIGILLNRKGDFGTAHDILLREAKEGKERSEDSKYALGINLLRLRLLPSEIKDADQPMVTKAGEIAMDLSRSDYGPATAKFDQLLIDYPGRGFIHDAYGWTLMSISRYDAAVEQYRKETQLSPNSPDAYLGLATAAMRTHNFEEARAAAKKAVELDPGSALAHGEYGRALLELSDLNGGIAELEKAVQLGVAIPELHFSLSRAYARAKRPKDAERERRIFLRLSQQQKN